MSKKALCFGINDYPGSDSDLAGCVNDALDWSAELANQGFAVKTILDAQATHAAMTQAIGALIQGAAAGDTLVITYSGHGTWVPDTTGDESDGRDEGLCPFDIASAGPLLDDDIREMFAARGAGVRIVLISDSCHSGSVTRAGLPELEDDLDAGQPRPRFLPLAAWMPASELPAAGASTAARPRGLGGGLQRVGSDLLLAGCLDSQFSWDTRFRGRPNGAFTYYALKTLREASPATYEDWFAAIRAYLPSTRLPQDPQILGSTDARRARVFA